MPFPEPETALASKIGAVAGEIIVRDSEARPRACKVPPTIFPPLTRRLNNLPLHQPFNQRNALFKTVILPEADYFG